MGKTIAVVTTSNASNTGKAKIFSALHEPGGCKAVFPRDGAGSKKRGIYRGKIVVFRVAEKSHREEKHKREPKPSATLD
jgi:hypothetical protein